MAAGRCSSGGREFAKPAGSPGFSVQQHNRVGVECWYSQHQEGQKVNVTIGKDKRKKSSQWVGI